MNSRKIGRGDNPLPFILTLPSFQRTGEGIAGTFGETRPGLSLISPGCPDYVESPVERVAFQVSLAAKSILQYHHFFDLT
jgi:hypothetical protein